MKRWRKKAKTGRHTFRFQGVKITTVPGDVIECFETNLGSCAAEYDCLGPVDGAPEEVSAEKPITDGKTLELVHLGRGYWNIINPDNPDKPLNDKALRKDEAEAILGEMLDNLVKKGELLITEIKVFDECKTEEQIYEAVCNANVRK